MIIIILIDFILESFLQRDQILTLSIHFEAIFDDLHGIFKQELLN